MSSREQSAIHGIFFEHGKWSQYLVLISRGESNENYACYFQDNKVMKKLHILCKFMKIFNVNFLNVFFWPKEHGLIPHGRKQRTTTVRSDRQFEYDNEKKFGVLQFHGMCLLAQICMCECVSVCTCEFTLTPPYTLYEKNRRQKRCSTGPYLYLCSQVLSSHFEWLCRTYTHFFPVEMLKTKINPHSFELFNQGAVFGQLITIANQ